jgi:hypothetical protein
MKFVRQTIPFDKAPARTKIIYYNPPTCTICLEKVKFLSHNGGGLTQIGEYYYHTECINAARNCRCYMCRFVYVKMLGV